MHTYRDLLSDNPRGKQQARSLARKRFSPSLFVVHFGVEGTWPGIPHHMILFGPRYKGCSTTSTSTAYCRRTSRSICTIRP
jgi:phytoene desaturase